MRIQILIYKFCAFFIFFFLLSTAVSFNLTAQSKKKKDKIDQLPRKYEVVDTTDTIDYENLTTTINHHEQLIAKYPSQTFIPYLMFELAELYASRSQYEFKQKMKEYDEEIVKYEAGKSFREPILPRISLKDAIEIGYKLIEMYPNIPYKDKVLYRLAISHLDEGNQDKTKDYFQQMLFETPNSPKISEAHFRLGEYYFNQRNFQKAIEYYEHLLERWDNPYFNYSLYKLGWSYFNVSDYSNSISTFIYLISDITLLESLNTELLGKTKADVRNEAIDYIAHSLTEYDGSMSLKELLSKDETQSYAIDVLKKMGEIYKGRNFYNEAINIYQTLLDLFPFYPDAPMIQREIIQCYESDLDEDKAARAKDMFVQKYGPESDWLKQYPEGTTRENAVTMSEEMLFSLGTHYQAKAQEKNREREYRLAIEKHEDYLKKFRDSERAVKVNFYLAECYYAINEYEKAADEYFKVMTFYGNNEFKESSAYNRILSYYELLKQQSKKDSTTFYIEDFIGGGEAVIPIRVGCEAQFSMIKACNDFIRQIPSSENLLAVFMKYAETLYELEKWNLAARVYKKVVQPQYRSSPFYGQSINMIAQCYLKLGNYKESELWFNNLADAFPDSAQYVQRAKKMVASAKFKHAEKLKEQGKTTSAAVNFLKLAFETKDQEIAKASVFQAANQFEQAGDIEKAIKTYERMLEEQPNVDFKDELLMKAGMLYEKSENWIRASTNYIQLVNQCPNSKFAPRALLNAALCFEQLKLWFKCKQTYKEYINRFANNDGDDLIEAMYKVGEISYNQDDKVSAVNEFQAMIQKYKELTRNRITVEEYLPAKAQFLIAEINFEKYKQVKLVPPLNISMKQKTDLLQQVLKDYVEAGKYQVAEWTTASLYKTGLTFENLAESIQNSPVPDQYSEDERQTYLAAIQKQVVSAKQKALDVYKANITNAKKSKIQNEWIDQSKQRLEQLVLELGLDSQSSITQQPTQPKIVPTSQTKEINDEANK